MENKKYIQNIILKFGGVLGLLSVIIQLLNYSFGDVYYNFKSQSLKAEGKTLNMIIGVLGFVAMVLIIVYAIKIFKQSNGSLLSLGQAVKIGLGVALISGIIVVIYHFVFANIIEPDYYAKGYEFMEQAMIEQNPDMSEEQMEMGLKIAKKITSPLAVSFMGLLGSLFFGLVTSLITGAILKKQE